MVYPKMCKSILRNYRTPCFFPPVANQSFIPLITPFLRLYCAFVLAPVMLKAFAEQSYCSNVFVVLCYGGESDISNISITALGNASPHRPTTSSLHRSFKAGSNVQLSAAVISFLSFPSPKTRRLFPFGAGLILGVLLLVYVTVRVTISLTCLTPAFDILGLCPLFESKYLPPAALFGPPPPLPTPSQLKCDLALNGLLIALVQLADIGCADIGVPQPDNGDVTSWMVHAGEAGICRRIRPLELSGAEAGTLGRAN